MQLAGERCEKSFASAGGNKEEELKMMLEWAHGGFIPTGPDGFSPPDSTCGFTPKTLRTRTTLNKLNINRR